MTLLRPLFDRLVGARTESVVYECRDCGTSLDGDREACPNCNSEAITCYNVS